jgi:hypothetical protein
MRLHAVLGDSKVLLASVIMSWEWEEIYLYCDDKSRVKDFQKGLSETEAYLDHMSSRSTSIQFREIPSLDRQHNDMLSMIKKTRERLPDFPKAGSKDVLFYSGTPSHVALFTTIMGFKEVISFRGTDLVFKASGQIIESPVWDIESILALHGLSSVDGKLQGIRKFDQKPLGLKISKKCNYRMELDPLSGTKIKFGWEVPVVPTERKLFQVFVIESRKVLAGSVIHEVDDEYLNNWCRNTRLPPPVSGYFEEE